MRQARFLLPLLAAGYLAISATPGEALSQEAICLGETATIVGTPGPDRLRGTPGRDGDEEDFNPYGTKLYYRDLNGQPDYPLTAPPSPTQKLLDVYGYLSAHDPSRLPWNSTERLQACFVRYFVDLDRNVDFFNVWLPAVEPRTNLMLADPECKPL